MFAILGILVVFGSIISGFLIEKGNIHVLMQPAELLIIVGAASGTLLPANPMHIIKDIAHGLAGLLKGAKQDAGDERKTLAVSELFSAGHARRWTFPSSTATSSCTFWHFCVSRILGNCLSKRWRSFSFEMACASMPSFR